MTPEKKFVVLAEVGLVDKEVRKPFGIGYDGQFATGLRYIVVPDDQ